MLNKKGLINSTKVAFALCKFEEANHKLDPEQSVTITVALPLKSEKLGITLESDPTFGFPVLKRVHLMSPLQMQIPIDCKCVF